MASASQPKPFQVTGGGQAGAPVLNFCRRFVHNQSGATAIEYCLIAAFIFLAIVTAVGLVGTSLVAKFQTVAGGLQ